MQHAGIVCKVLHITVSTQLYWELGLRKDNFLIIISIIVVVAYFFLGAYFGEVSIRKNHVSSL